ncbi:MAG: ArsR family transcriptional regulator, partial [Candidatus Copromonas sp.]|nr:ArsR family transcriptional regulator [Candidatus Copromonas sp.]
RTSLSRPAVSHHLKILKDTGLIDVLRKGVCNYYYLTNKSAIDKLGRLKEELEKYPES